MQFLEKFGILPIQAVVLTGILAVVYILPMALFPVYLGLAYYAFRGPRESIEALSISFILVFLNPGIFYLPETVLMLRWFVLIAAFARIVLMFQDRELSLFGPVSSILLFGLVIGLLAVVGSYHPVISILKLFQFMIGVLTIFYAFRFTSDMRTYWTKWFTSYFLLVILLSAPFYFLPEGYTRNDVGFQGILNHPQAFGVFLAPMTLWFIARFISGESRELYLIFGFLLGFIFIFASQARVALVALVLAFVISMVVKFIRGEEFIPITGNTIEKYFLPVAAVSGILLIILNLGMIKERFNEFMVKHEEYTSLEEGYQQTRGMLIEKSMQNFREHPIAGIGFGLDSDITSQSSSQASGLGIVFSAASEKGFIGSAVLEEVGIFGACILIIFIGSMIIFVVKTGTFAQWTILFTGLLVNIAEMVFFSFGGTGLYIWLLLGYATIPRK